MIVILDASALLSVIFEERGAERVTEMIEASVIGTANFCEVMTKIVDQGLDAGIALGLIDRLNIRVVDFDRSQAEAAAYLRIATRSAGLSLGDRACLALAASLDGVALTCDQAWARLPADIGIKVELAR